MTMRRLVKTISPKKWENARVDYHTRDLGLAAALITLGKEVTSLEPFNDRAFTFVINVSFADGKSLETDYYNNLMVVPAFKLGQEIRNLKKRISEELGQS